MQISRGGTKFPGGSVVKSLPVIQDTQVQYLGWEDPLEKGMATHSNILAWRIPWTEELRGLQSRGSERVRHDNVINTHLRESTAVFPIFQLIEMGEMIKK